MATSELFSLCWDNFHRNLGSGMTQMLENSEMVDVTLAVEGRYLKAHKMVLSICSPYFKELFSVTPCKHPVVFLKDVSFNVMSDLLQFMYQGEVQVSQENLTIFIKTAEALHIKGLTGDGNGNSEDIDDTQKLAYTTSSDSKKVTSRPKRAFINTSSGGGIVNSSSIPAASSTNTTNQQAPSAKRARPSFSGAAGAGSTSTSPAPINSSSSTTGRSSASQSSVKAETEASVTISLKSEPSPQVDSNNASAVSRGGNIDDDLNEDESYGDEYAAITAEKSDDLAEIDGDYSLLEAETDDNAAGSSLDGTMAEGKGEIFFESGTKKPKIILYGHEYLMLGSRTDRTTWICNRYYHAKENNRCKVRIVTRHGSAHIYGRHNHAPRDRKISTLLTPTKLVTVVFCEDQFQQPVTMRKRRSGDGSLDSSSTEGHAPRMSAVRRKMSRTTHSTDDEVVEII